MELTVHHPNPAKRRDECHGIEATARVEQLVKASGKRVRLTAEHASSRSDSASPATSRSAAAAAGRTSARS